MKYYLILLGVIFTYGSSQAACFTDQEADFAECKREFSITKDNECKQIYPKENRKNFIGCKYTSIEVVRNKLDEQTYMLNSLVIEKYSKNEIQTAQKQVGDSIGNFGKLLAQTQRSKAYEVEKKRQDEINNAATPFAFSKKFYDFSEKDMQKTVDEFVRVLNNQKCNVTGNLIYADNTFTHDQAVISVVGTCPKKISKVDLIYVPLYHDDDSTVGSQSWGFDATLDIVGYKSSKMKVIRWHRY